MHKDIIFQKPFEQMNTIWVAAMRIVRCLISLDNLNRLILIKYDVYRSVTAWVLFIHLYIDYFVIRSVFYTIDKEYYNCYYYCYKL